MMNKVNLFIVGAPKCGTTSLHYYLGQHGDIFMSPRKEPCFFASDFQADEYPKTENEYNALFSGNKGEKYLGEATSTYLYSRTAAQEIYTYCPEARIIIMLRNPVDMIYSLHAQRLFEGSENIHRFERALEAESLRKTGKIIPPMLKYPIDYLYYREMGDYLPQISRYLKYFPRDQIKVIISEEFRMDIDTGVRNVIEFLGLSEVSIDLSPQRLGKKWISPTAAQFANSKLKQVVSPLMSRKFKHWIKNVMIRPTPKIRPETREMLQQEYLPTFKELEHITGCKFLDYWSR